MNNKTKGWKKDHFPKSREIEDKGVVAIAKSVSQLGCVSQDSDALVSQGTKEFRGDPMQKVLNAIRKVRVTKSTMRQASIREKKGPSLGKTKSFLVSEVPTLQNSRFGPTKRLDDNSAVSKTRLGILPKIFTSSKDSRYWPNEVNQDLKMAPHWSAQKWIDVLAKGGGQKKRFQYCLKLDEPERHLYLRVIQGPSGRAHSGNAPVDPVLQENELIPMNNTKYVYHVGHGNELRSTVRNGLIPARFST